MGNASPCTVPGKRRVTQTTQGSVFSNAYQIASSLRGYKGSGCAEPSRYRSHLALKVSCGGAFVASEHKTLASLTTREVRANTHGSPDTPRHA